MTDLASSYLILWASQTGNAEWIAKNIHSEAKKRGYTGNCFEMDKYEQAELDKARVMIMVTSNTGDGDPPDNALKFWRFIRRQKQNDFFAQCKITVLGLGDTNYSNFNNTGKRFEKKCKELGATVFYEKGLADDAEGLENVVDPWVETLWDKLPEVLKKEHETKVDELTTELENLSTEPTTEPLSDPATPAKLSSSSNVPKEGPSPSATLTGHILHIDYSELLPGAKLTGMPRLSAEAVKLEQVAKAPRSKSTNVPDFVNTPTPIHSYPITRARCLTTSDAVKRTLEVELDVGNDIHFEPGDAFGVLAPNDEPLVEAVLDCLTTPVEAYETLYAIKGEGLPSHLQRASSVTLADLLRYGLDLTTTPRKALFRLLAEYTDDVQEKTKLMFLCSKQGTSQFNAVRNQSPTLLDILHTFPSCKPPIERLLDVLPPHQPRYYSIANSPLAHPGKIRFAFNIIQYTTEKQVLRKGVATPWLDVLTGLLPPREGGRPAPLSDVHGSVCVPLFMRHNASAFVLPADISRPLVLIGPGTGIAPFVGFVKHRQAQRKIRQSMGGVVGARPSQDIKKEFGDIHVYYGFRDRTRDFLFREELEECVEDGTIKTLAIAESRTPSGEKKYVQDLILRDAKALYDVIMRDDAAVYVCGDAKGMAKGVQDALVTLLCEHGNMTPLEANKLLIEWTGSQKYLRDLWA